jgi:hypothetical protein
VRLPPPRVAEGLGITNDRGVRNALIAFGYMVFDATIAAKLVQYAAPQLVVEVLRNVSTQNSPRWVTVYHAHP